MSESTKLALAVPNDDSCAPTERRYSRYLLHAINDDKKMELNTRIEFLTFLKKDIY